MRRLLVLACLGSVAASGEKKPFAAVAGASGDEYLALRDALLARADANAILRAARDATKSEIDRWLAEALVARLETGDAFRGAQRDYREKFAKLYRDVGVLRRSGDWITCVGRGITVLVPGEEVPELPKSEFVQERVARTFDETRLVASPVRTLALAEIALKGVGKLPAEPADRFRTPSEDDFRFGALDRLLRDGEARALPAMLQFLKDPAASAAHRAVAAEMLGGKGYKEALPELLRLAEDEATLPQLRISAFDGIAALADPAAIPTLERIVKRHEGARKEPGNVGPLRWVQEAQQALRAIRKEK